MISLCWPPDRKKGEQKAKRCHDSVLILSLIATLSSLEAKNINILKAKAIFCILKAGKHFVQGR